MATFIQEVEGFKGDAALYEHEGFRFIVSSIDAMYSGFETLVFLAREATDHEVEVASWLEIAGGRGMDRGEAVTDLERLSAEDIRAFIDEQRR